MFIIEPQDCCHSSSFIKPKIPCSGEKLAPFCSASSVLLVLREMNSSVNMAKHDKNSTVHAWLIRPYKSWNTVLHVFGDDFISI